jgi:ComF family protein
MLSRLVLGSSPLRKWRPYGQCAICRSWCRTALCSICIDRFSDEGPRCGHCGLRLAAVAARCGACLRDPPPFQRCVCAVDYTFPWNVLIADLKFNASVELARPLAGQLLGAVLRTPGEQPELLLPIPLSRSRLAQRGFNQAWELTRHLSCRLGIGCSAHVLERPVDSAHQADLPLTQRLQNLRGVFFVNPRLRDRVAQRHVALVDDVMTSGATLREAAATLLRAGAARVDVWVIARTPPPQH